MEGFTQAITLLNQGRVDAVVNDSIAFHAYQAETNDQSVKIGATIDEKSEQAFAARKNSGLLPELNKALDELKADGTLATISREVPQGQRHRDRARGPVGTARRGSSSPDNLWPLAKAAITVTIPLTIISFVIGLVIALVVALGRLSKNVVVSNIARFYISIIRGTPLLVQLFIIFYALPQVGIKLEPFPAAVIAFSLNVGGYAAEIIRSAIQSIPKGQWEAAETIGFNYTGALRRIILPQAARVAVPAAVQHVDLAGQRHVAGVDHPGDRTAARRTGGRSADVRILRAVRHGRCVLLDHLPGALVRPEPPRTPTGKACGSMTDTTTSVEYRVVADGVEKAFGDNKVLKGVSFTVEQGTATAIIGPSGSGKTTLLRALNALDRPDAGVIRVDDVEIDFSKPVPKPEVRRFQSRSGFVFQGHNLFPHKTVLENITEGPLIVQKRPKDEVVAEAVELLDQVGLSAKKDQYPYQLSGGQQQRVGIARALALKPKLVLFDEPTSALDPELVGEVLSVIKDLAVEGWTLVIVTHEIQFAKQVSNQVLFTDQGVILEKGPPAEVIGNPKEERTRQFLDRILNPL